MRKKKRKEDTGEFNSYVKREAGILAIRCKRIIGEATNGDGTIDTGKL